MPCILHLTLEKQKRKAKQIPTNRDNVEDLVCEGELVDGSTAETEGMGRRAEKEKGSYVLCDFCCLLSASRSLSTTRWIGAGIGASQNERDEDLTRGRSQHRSEITSYHPFQGLLTTTTGSVEPSVFIFLATSQGPKRGNRRGSASCGGTPSGAGAAAGC